MYLEEEDDLVIIYTLFSRKSQAAPDQLQVFASVYCLLVSINGRLIRDQETGYSDRGFNPSPP